MKKLYFIRHAHGQYLGAKNQEVEFKWARTFNRRSDATLAFTHLNLDEDLWAIFVLEVSPTGLKHSFVKDRKAPEKETNFISVPSVFAERNPIRSEEVVPELILKEPKKDVYYIDVNNMSITDRDQHILKFKEELKKNPIVKHEAKDPLPHEETKVVSEVKNIDEYTTSEVKFNQEDMQPLPKPVYEEKKPLFSWTDFFMINW